MGFLEAVDRSVSILSQGLEARGRRHSAIAANIANVDTPGYRAVDASFAGLFQSSMASLPLAVTNGSHLAGVAESRGDVFVPVGGAARRDGNDVNIDQEMTKLARNQVEYQFLARRLSSKFGKLREAITGKASQ